MLSSLFALYKKSSKEIRSAELTKNPIVSNTTSKNLNSGIILALKDTLYDSIEKQTIEKSLEYLGYRILWVLYLFI